MGGWLRSFRNPGNALAELDAALFQASLACAEVVRPELEKCPEKQRQEMWVRALFEAIYFFMHLTMRNAYGRLGQQKGLKLQETFGPLVIHSTIEALFKHWPADTKQKIEAEFYENLNRAESEYSECAELMTEGQPLSETALIPRLAKNIAEAIGQPHNIVALMGVQTVVVHSLVDMHLDELVTAAAGEI